jgi:hypothetical protein
MKLYLSRTSDEMIIVVSRLTNILINGQQTWLCECIDRRYYISNVERDYEIIGEL